MYDFEHSQELRMKFLSLICCSLLLASCATDRSYSFHTTERMLPNGNWELNLYSTGTCQEIIAEQVAGSSKTSDKPEVGLFNKSLSDIIHPKRIEEDPEMYNKCIEVFKQNMAPRAKSLCSNNAYELYGCVHVKREELESSYQNSTWVMGCYLKCK